MYAIKMEKNINLAPSCLQKSLGMRQWFKFICK